jgi:hypothetical protein
LLRTHRSIAFIKSWAQINQFIKLAQTLIRNGGKGTQVVRVKWLDCDRQLEAKLLVVLDIILSWMMLIYFILDKVVISSNKAKAQNNWWAEWRYSNDGRSGGKWAQYVYYAPLYKHLPFYCWRFLIKDVIDPWRSKGMDLHWSREFIFFLVPNLYHSECSP